MPRKPREDDYEAIHHVIARGNGGSSIVRDDDDRSLLVQTLSRVSITYAWQVHAYRLMNNHLHLVGETDGSLSTGMQRLLGGYAFEFNRRHGLFGHLYAGRFSSSALDSDAYAIEVSAYVVLNPTRAGLARVPEDWGWSSYRSSAGLISVSPFLETRLVPGTLHRNPRRARELYRDFVRDVGERPRPASGQSLTPATLGVDRHAPAADNTRPPKIG